MAAAKTPTLEEIESVFAALSHEARRHIVLLLSHTGGELPSGYLAARFQHSWPTTTRHLSVLQDAGLVTVRREGRSSAYRLDRERLTRVLRGWLRLLTPPTPEKTWPPEGPRSLTELKARHAPDRRVSKSKTRTRTRSNKKGI
jgi:DNA-binding transcriptional ArsR family regulator